MSQRKHRTLLLVVGMHRSGTSALCAALQASGASFGTSLLDPMSGVNDEGFWEDESVVSVNERLLSQLGLRWFTVAANAVAANAVAANAVAANAVAASAGPVDWAAARFDPLREEALALVKRGFGDAAVEAVKDPRFCITLPFWLAVAAACEVDTVVCAISRAPMEVAASLQKRDGLPLAYGLRLYAAYHQALAQQAPAGTVYLSYTDLLHDPVQVVRAVAATAQLTLDCEAPELSRVVRSDLRHQSSGEGGGPLYRVGEGEGDLQALFAAIESDFPCAASLQDMAEALVERGQQLSAIGEEHSRTLATLDERDADVSGLAAELAQAVATVAERDVQIEDFDQRLSSAGEHLAQALATLQQRDEQIREFDRRLAEIGQLHSEALALIESRDAQLQRVFAKPAVGLLFKAMWSRESR